MSDTNLPATRGPSEAAAILEVVANAAADPNCDPAKMQALVDLRLKVVAEQRRIDFHDALARVQSEIEPVKKDGTIPLKDNKVIRFAKFESIQGIVKPLLRAEGFTTRYDERVLDGVPIKAVTVTLTRGGHSESCTLHIPLKDEGPSRNATQSMVSANSYGRRRALIQMLDIVMEGEDNDGAGDLTPVTEAEANQLKAELAAAGGNPQRFLVWMGVEYFAEIPARDWGKAKQGIRDREVANARKAAEVENA